MLRFSGERGPKPNTKVFNNQTLYLTFLSSKNAEVDVQPVFIDPLKANSLKFVTAVQTHKLDSSMTGEDPKAPSANAMMKDFVNRK